MKRQPWSVRSYDELRTMEYPGLGPSVVALGTFDGVHIGHQHILREASALAASLKVMPIALTFDRHPLTTLAPGKAPKLLTPLSQRIDRIRVTGICHVAVLRFDDQLARLPAERFLAEILLRALGAQGIVVGYNFRFGEGAKGDTTMLQNEAAVHGVDVRVIEPVKAGEEHISSTRIRQALEAGKIDEANRLLGYSFTMRGHVTQGDARGRTLGYPTANLTVHEEALWPGDGVYLTEVGLTSGEGYRLSIPALTVISDRPSFNTNRRTIESFLLDFDNEIYGQELEVSFYRRLRDIVRFSGPDELKAQITRDVQAAMEFFDSEKTTARAKD